MDDSTTSQPESASTPSQRLRSTQGLRPTVPPTLMNAAGSALQSSSPFVLAVRRRTLTPWLFAIAMVVLVWIFRQTLTLALVAFSAAYVMGPAVRKVEKVGVPRPVAIILVLLTGVALFAGVVAKLVPELIRQIQQLVSSLPRYGVAIQKTWIPWINKKFHVHISDKAGEALSQLGLKASEFTPKLTKLLDNTLDVTIRILELMLTGIIVGALTFYFLMDMESTVDSVFALVPHRARDRVRSIASEIDRTLKDFMQGQLLVMVILGGLFAIGLGMLGVPAGWAIGVFAGMISFVPYVGFFVALGLALLMALLEGRGLSHVASVLVVMMIVHVLDFTVITPRIVGSKAKLSPVVVILSLLAGGSVFGFIGILLAIPVASVLRVLLRELIAYYQSTPFFLVGQAPIALDMLPTDAAASSIPSLSELGATSTLIPPDLATPQSTSSATSTTPPT